MLRSLGSAMQPVMAFAEKTVGCRFRPALKPDIPAQRFDPIPVTESAEIDRVISSLNDQAQVWADTAPAKRAELLRQCISTTLDVSEEAAEAATRAKGSYGQGIGDELLPFLPIISGLREYAETMEALAAGAAPKPEKLYRHSNGQWIADVWPQGLENLLFGGTTGELWIEPGKEPTQAQCYRNPEACPAGVGVVLGAGNHTPVAALDILHVLIATNQVVCCKMNPVNEYMGPYLRRAFQPFVDAGFLEFVYGGGKEGAMVCNHPKVRSVHLTGSGATYDAIVWQGNPKVGSPPFTKHVGAELGCVTPYVIVPGKWSDSDLKYHAATVATGLTQNAGHQCLKAEILVTDAAWPQREAFLEALREELAATPNRTAFYPGSGKKLTAFLQNFPDVEQFGDTKISVHNGQLKEEIPEFSKLPWMLKSGLTPEKAVTDTENWCGVLQEVALPNTNGDISKFLDEAVKFSNEECFGTLSCAVIAHPATQKAHKKAFEGAIEGLKYGTICINVPGNVGFGATKLAWGGWPGADPKDIGSGDAKVHNTLLFDHVQKSVLRGRWRSYPHPLWFMSHRNLEAVARESLRFMAKPSLLGVNPLAWQAVKG